MDDTTTNGSASSTKKRWGIVHWLIVGVVLILGFALVEARWHEVKSRVYHQGICFDCRNIANVLHRYAVEHGGNYPDGATSNDALRELFNEDGMSQMIQDERQFAKEAHFTPYKADSEIGIAPSFDRALEKNENHWAMTKGVNNESPGSIPLLFENPAVASWPPYWNVAEANKRVPGRALKVPTVASATTGNYEVPVTGKNLSGYSIFIARKDGSVSNEELGAPNGAIATLAPDASSRNIFEQAGPHEVLDVAKQAGTSEVMVQPPQQEPPASTKPGKGEVYISANKPANKITLISGSECEMAYVDGVILGTYTLDGDTIRFVFSMFGTQEVIYAKVYSDGIVMTARSIYSEGEVLLNALGRKQKEVADRTAKEKMDRIIRDAPTMLVGLWKESRINSDKPGVIANTYLRQFKPDGKWAEDSGSEMVDVGKWKLLENSNEIGMDYGPMTLNNVKYKLVELSENSYSIELISPGRRVVATLKADRMKQAAAIPSTGGAASMPVQKESVPSDGKGSSGETEQQRLSRLLVGSWSRYSGRVFYFEDGRYVTDPKSGSGEMGQWQIKEDGTLIHTARSGQVRSNKIFSLDARELLLDAENGPRIYYSRDEEAGKPMSSDGTQAKEDSGASATPVFSTPSVTLAEVKAFISAHHAKASRGDTAGLGADYAQTVVFLDKGLLSPARIQEEEAKDREKWPEGGERIVGEPKVVKEDGMRWLASYTLEFYQKNAAGDWVSGTADMRLAILPEGARLLITSQKANVRDVKKGKTR